MISEKDLEALLMTEQVEKGPEVPLMTEEVDPVIQNQKNPPEENQNIGTVVVLPPKMTENPEKNENVFAPALVGPRLIEIMPKDVILPPGAAPVRNIVH